MFGNYSKLAGAIIGNIVAILAVWLATRGMAECVPAASPDLDQVCTIFGFTTAQITAAVLSVLNTGFVYFFPPNRPS